MKPTEAENFVDATAMFRLLGDEAAEYSITAETIKTMLEHTTVETFQRGPYSKWLTFHDGSCAAQVRGAKRWDMYR